MRNIMSYVFSLLFVVSMPSIALAGDLQANDFVGVTFWIISISMVLTMIIAGLFGILVPVTLKKMNIDPAIASSVFVTTITDVIGFVSFLGVGAYFL